jgi:hypothetical protein
MKQVLEVDPTNEPAKNVIDMLNKQPKAGTKPKS